MSPIIKRILLFQFLILFCYYRISNNLETASSDFKKRLVFNMNLMGFKDLGKKEIFIEQYKTIIFQGFLGLLVLSSISSIIFNSKFFQSLSGYFTIIIAFLYCNPVTTMKKNFKNYKYYSNNKISWIAYLPNYEFLVLISLGFGMLAYAFNDDYFDIKKGKKEETKNKSEREDKNAKKEKSE